MKLLKLNDAMYTDRKRNICIRKSDGKVEPVQTTNRSDGLRRFDKFRNKVDMRRNSIKLLGVK